MLNSLICDSSEYSQIWVNGEVQDYIHVSDRGLQYGDGFFETILISGKSLPYWDFHLKRIKDTQRRLNFNLDYQLLLQIISKVLKEISISSLSDFHVLKLIFTRAFGGKAYSPIGADGSTIIAIARTFLPLDVKTVNTGVYVAPCQFVLPMNSAIAGMKLLNSINYVLASFELTEENIFEGLLCDKYGNYIEGTKTNIWFISGERITTPSLEHAGVAGVMRSYLLSNLKKYIDFDIRIKNINQELLLEADEMFLTNAVLGVVPVKSIKDMRQFNRVEVSSYLAKQLQKDIKKFI